MQNNFDNQQMKLTILELSFIVLIGGSDKSTFALKHFKPRPGGERSTSLKIGC